MEAPASMLLRPINWLIGRITAPTEPAIRTPTVQVLKIPPDGSPPQVVELHTIEVASEGNVDCFLVHIPDFRVYWGKYEGISWRDIAGRTFRDQPVKELNGFYVGWKSFALDLMPISEQTGFCGDAFIAKLPLWENDENGAVYEDIPDAFVKSQLYPEMLEAMHDR